MVGKDILYCEIFEIISKSCERSIILSLDVDRVIVVKYLVYVLFCLHESINTGNNNIGP